MDIVENVLFLTDKNIYINPIRPGPFEANKKLERCWIIYLDSN